MCIFSRDITSVFATKIFTRKPAPNRQYLVYEMGYETSEELAMILPLPIDRDGTDEPIRFIDLSDYGNFFNDLDQPFTPNIGRASLTINNLTRLKIHRVGSFEASFVPSIADFARLDPRFCLPEDIWQELSIYKDYGFAVFKLKPEVNRVHPMAMEFESNCHRALFFPTMHIHHQKFKASAVFDHLLYCQKSVPNPAWEISEELWGWKQSQPLPSQQEQYLPAAKFMDIPRCQAIIDPDLPIQKLPLQGRYENKDLLIPLSPTELDSSPIIPWV